MPRIRRTGPAYARTIESLSGEEFWEMALGWATDPRWSHENAFASDVERKATWEGVREDWLNRVATGGYSRPAAWWYFDSGLAEQHPFGAGATLAELEWLERHTLLLGCEADDLAHCRDQAARLAASAESIERNGREHNRLTAAGLTPAEAFEATYRTNGGRTAGKETSR